MHRMLDKDEILNTSINVYRVYDYHVICFNASAHNTWSYHLIANDYSLLTHEITALRLCITC